MRALLERSFKGATDFRGATFNEGVYFDHVTFEEVHFSEANYEATFKGNVSFLGTTFTKAHFQNAIFEKDAYFDKTVIGEGNFSKARFENETTFGEAAFEGWVSFSDATFEKRASLNDVAFKGLAQFADTTFLEDVAFERAVFSDVADFSKAKFCAASIGTTDFSGASFKGLAYFFDSTFEGQAHFNDATFETVTFEDATFSEGAYFSRATFKSEAYFRGRETFSRVADFQFARIEKPEVFSFHSARLRPSWFVNVDPRKFDFTEVQWPERLGGPKVTLDDEISSLQRRGVQHFYNPYILLSQVCRRLSTNAEENHEYPLANEFHYWSMDALRIGRWRYLGWLRQFIEKNWRRISARFGLMATLLWIWRIFRREPLRHRMPSRFGLVPTFYWALNGYGVRAGRAFWMLVAIWAAFTTLYVLVGPSEFKDFGQGIGYRWQAAVYSLLALARLNPEPRPEEPGAFQFLVGVEGILGPLQIALLALAVRRRVMR
jgi:uncharacterized protein YjbI with pentapeptide repeats